MPFYRTEVKEAYARQYKNILAKRMKEFVIIILIF